MTDTTIRPPLTLDDVSKRIDAICNEHVENARRFADIYTTNLEGLADAVEASPDLDKKAVGNLVLGRIQRMLPELQEAVA